jgi:hypothetical protein
MLAFCKETGPAGLIYHKSKESKRSIVGNMDAQIYRSIESKNHYGDVRLGSQLFHWFAWYESHAEDEPKRTASKTRWKARGHDGYGEVCARALFRRLNASFGAQTTLFPHFWDQNHTNIHVLSPVSGYIWEIRVYLLLQNLIRSIFYVFIFVTHGVM